MRTTPRTAHISCLARPTEALRKRLDIMYPERRGPANGRVGQVLDDIVRVDALARLLTEGLERLRTMDGRLDPLELAAFVLERMHFDGGAGHPQLSLAGEVLDGRAATELEARVVDQMAAKAFASLLTEAIERTQATDGLTDTRAVAVFVLRRVKEARR